MELEALERGGVEGGEGATTVARNLADLVAREFSTPVCLVRVADDAGEEAVGASGATPPKGAASSLAPVRRAAEGDAEPGEVLLVELSRRGLNAALEAGFRDSLGRISQYAGVFLVDGPPILESLDAGRLCREVDGMILVAEADRTTPDSVDAARAAIEGYGGRIVGGVLNKRRRRLPTWLAAALGGTFRPRIGATIAAPLQDNPR